ncbi:hypothetical protein KY343_06415 [Candidatus Woesearchaeota archaeon]|nr:hypothetical protein [Candidatus Woesearchaeota archaeon]
MERFSIHQKIFLIYLIAAIISWLFLATINIPLSVVYLIYLISFFLIIKGKKIGWLLITIVFLGRFLIWLLAQSLIFRFSQAGFLVLGVYSLMQYLNFKKHQKLINIITGIATTYMLINPSLFYLWIVSGVLESALIWSMIITIIYWLVVIYWIKYKK